jgi:DNA-binding CsgD family transcriptional regulator
MCLHRADARAGFDEAARSALARLAPHIAEGLRLSMLLDPASIETDADGPGVIVLEADLTLAAITPAAEPWLAEIATDWPAWGPLPVPIYAVAARLLEGDPARGGPPRLRVRGASGRWLTVHASQLLGNTPKIAVVIEAARPEDTIPVVLRARGLSSREADVARLVLRGYSTRQIVDRLHISRYTVQDHLKSVFEKTGVRSRRELVAELMSPAHP